jgi:hypothetical protein
VTTVPPSAEAWAAAGQAARGHAPDLAEALAVHIASGPDGRKIAELVGAAIARAAHDAVEAAAPHIRVAAVEEERERWCRIEPDPEQPGYNRGVFDVSGFTAEVVAGERDAIRAQVYAEIRQLAAESGATYEVRRPCSCGASHCRGVLLDAHAQFADLIPVGETDG